MLQQNPLMLGMDQETVRYFEQMAPVASKMVAARLEEPDIDEFCQLGRDFFNDYAGKFDFMVPPKRAIQIKKFFSKSSRALTPLYLSSSSRCVRRWDYCQRTASNSS